MANESMAKMAGKAKGAAKALAGYPGIFHHLAGEHAEVSTLMKRVAESEDAATRRELFPKIRKNLLAHARGEEAEFYPRLQRFPEVKSLVERCLQEHQQVEAYLDELDRMDKASAEWSRKFDHLKEVVEAHVHREEKELFPQAKDLLESDEARDMEDRYERVEEAHKQRLS